MTIWYEARRDDIRERHVASFTEKTVLVNGIRRNRIGAYASFFPTWEEAHAHLLRQAEREVADARRHLERASGLLGNVKGMKPPVAA